MKFADHYAAVQRYGWPTYTTLSYNTRVSCSALTTTVFVHLKAMPLRNSDAEQRIRGKPNYNKRYYWCWYQFYELTISHLYGVHLVLR